MWLGEGSCVLLLLRSSRTSSSDWLLMLFCPFVRLVASLSRLLIWLAESSKLQVSLTIWYTWPLVTDSRWRHWTLRFYCSMPSCWSVKCDRSFDHSSSSPRTAWYRLANVCNIYKKEDICYHKSTCGPRNVWPLPSARPTDVISGRRLTVSMVWKNEPTSFLCLLPFWYIRYPFAAGWTEAGYQSLSSFKPT